MWLESDPVLILMVIDFFAACAAYVVGCSRL
jgi:hypothetical protein